MYIFFRERKNIIITYIITLHLFTNYLFFLTVIIDSVVSRFTRRLNISGKAREVIQSPAPYHSFPVTARLPLSSI